MSATARITRAGLAAAALCLGLAACGDPDFDERYADKEKQLASEASALEAELDKRMSEKPLELESGDAGGTEVPPAGTKPTP